MAGDARFDSPGYSAKYCTYYTQVSFMFDISKSKLGCPDFCQSSGSLESLLPTKKGKAVSSGLRKQGVQALVSPYNA